MLALGGQFAPCIQAADDKSGVGVAHIAAAGPPTSAPRLLACNSTAITPVQIGQASSDVISSCAADVSDPEDRVLRALRNHDIKPAIARLQRRDVCGADFIELGRGRQSAQGIGIFVF